MDRKVLDKMNYGLFVVGTAWQGKRIGCVVNSFAQVTSNMPQKFTITLNRDNETCKALLESRSFAVTLIGKDCPKTLIDLFGYKSSRVSDKYTDYETFTDSMGNPFIKEGMVARVSCKVVDTMDVGRYVLFLCDSVDGELLGEGRMLTADEYPGKNKSSTPPTATVYRTLEEVGGWVCPWCGFVYYGEKLPDGYVCPLCGCPGDKFTRKEG